MFKQEGDWYKTESRDHSPTMLRSLLPLLYAGRELTDQEVASGAFPVGGMAE